MFSNGGVCYYNYYYYVQFQIIDQRSTEKSISNVSKYSITFERRFSFQVYMELTSEGVDVYFAGARGL